MSDKVLTLTEEECNEFLSELSEIPFKWSAPLIDKIRYNFQEQNKPKEEKVKENK